MLTPGFRLTASAESTKRTAEAEALAVIDAVLGIGRQVEHVVALGPIGPVLVKQSK